MLSLHPLIRLHSKDNNLNMAARFVVTLALVGLCASAPGGYRQERAYSIGQAYNAAGGSSAAQANANSNSAQAFGSTDGGQLARNGFYYPGQAIAQAQTYEQAPIPFGGAKAIAQAHNGAELLQVPTPAAVITYQQNYELPAYQPGAAIAQSSTLNNDASEATNSFASSNGNGIAQSSANTQLRGYGQTTSNAKTYGGAGFADSNAKTGYGSTSTSARTQGQGSASSNAAINEPSYAIVPVATPVEVVPDVVIEAKSPLYHTAYVPSGHIVPVASSNANVVGAGNAASSARINDGGLTYGRTISWRFGSQYDSPASTHAQANSNGYGSAKSAANTNLGGYGNAQSFADTNGSGSASADAKTNYGYGYARNGAEYNGAYYGGSRTSADAQTNGFGNAASSARTQGLNTAFRVANSQANSSGYGSAQANAQSA